MPCFTPLSTCTSKIFTSFTTFLPSHFLQRSFSLITSPSPLQSVHIDCICWTIPGASCLIMTRMPRPLQAVHFWTAPVLPPWPWQVAHSTFLLNCNLVVLPL